MNPIQTSSPMPHRPALGGVVRMTLVAMALGVVAFAFSAPGSFWDGEDQFKFLGFVAITAGGAALFVQGILAMFRWAFEGFDRESRSYFTRSAALLVFAVGVGLIAAMFREEISAPYPTSEGCWYTLRDRWTGEIEIKRGACPGDWQSRPERSRVRPVAMRPHFRSSTN